MCTEAVNLGSLEQELEYVQQTFAKLSARTGTNNAAKVFVVQSLFWGMPETLRELDRRACMSSATSASITFMFLSLRQAVGKFQNLASSFGVPVELCNKFIDDVDVYVLALERRIARFRAHNAQQADHPRGRQRERYGGQTGIQRATSASPSDIVSLLKAYITESLDQSGGNAVVTLLPDYGRQQRR